MDPISFIVATLGCAVLMAVTMTFGALLIAIYMWIKERL